MLCGYRDNGNPNTSDNNDPQSKVIGQALFTVLDVPPGQVGPTDAGAALETAVQEHLASIRPDLEIRRSRSAHDFEQYAHLKVFPTFRKAHEASDVALAGLSAVIDTVANPVDKLRLSQALERTALGFRQQDSLVADLLSQMPEEALLKIDITAAQPRSAGLPVLHTALSAKWSLRTDRAQDCVSQGAKLVAQRRGRMPHFAVVTIEVRPSMLKILGDGSGSVDCVYHLDLPALQEAMENVASSQRSPESWSPMKTFRRLLRQRRLRDYDDLVKEVERLPARPLIES